MKREDKTALKIILGVLGCLGCAGILVVVGVFGFGVWTGFNEGLMSPVPVSTPTAPGFPAVALPPGWSPYTQTSRCPINVNLRLTQFRAAYPSSYTALRCENQEPQPWGYVTFHLEDASGAADKQITLGFSRGAPTQAMLESASGQIVSQLGGPPPRLLDANPFPARGQNLTRRDAVFTLPAASGVFAPGPYLIRQVVVPGPGFNAEGINLTLLHRVKTTEAEAILESNPVLLQAVSAIQF